MNPTQSMLPIGELSKQSKELGQILLVVAVVYTVGIIVHSYAQYQLAKTSKQLAELQIKKLRSEGIV